MTTTDPVHDPNASARSCSDVRLVADVAQTVAVPREHPADSFVLHAPLELVARAALLPFVAPDQRSRARDRVLAIGTEFEAFGPPVVQPAADELPSVEAAATRLALAIEAGELDDVDRTARWLGRAATAAELRDLLSADVVPRLAAAAHGPIFLYGLPRVAPRGEITGELLRGLARELGRAPAWRLHWIDDAPASTAGTDPDADAMFDALASVPLGERADGDTPFIYPLMARVDELGIASARLRDVVDGPDVRERGRAVLRAAAWTMLLEPGDHAPYGWSHCLTMPQAVLGLAGTVAPRTALAVAATYVVGFRSALAVNALDPAFPSDDPRLPLDEAIAAGPRAAAAAVWHGGLDHRQVVGELATRASVQHDAHLVKYTLACIDAAAADPEHATLFLAAAASLAGWWARIDPATT